MNALNANAKQREALAHEALQGAVAGARPPSMTGDSLQKLGWHIQRIEQDLEGARALREAFPLLPEAAQRHIVSLLQRGMR
jgi:hypothetical protein